jgi:hypothetical protein
VHTDTVSAHLHRLNWLLRARVVEAKLRDLERTVKAGFDPNEPRVPAGSGRTSGRWTAGVAARLLRRRLHRKRASQLRRRTPKQQFVGCRSWTPLGAPTPSLTELSKARLQLPKLSLWRQKHVRQCLAASELATARLRVSQFPHEDPRATSRRVSAPRSIASVPRRVVILAVELTPEQVRATLSQTISLQTPEIHPDGRSVYILIALHAADAKAIG